MNICCWNVRTLLDLEKTSRPERRTALVTKELQRLNIDIAALSETRLAEEDQLIESKSGYTLFWIGKPSGVRRDGGVGFAIRSALVDKMERPTGINDRIMKLRVPLTCGRYLSVLSVYAPTMQATEETIMSFYKTLSSTIRSVPKEEKLIILGDFNARVGKEHQTWNALGRHGIGKANSNGLLLLQLCSELDLVICNTFFHQKLKHKVTWTHPRSKHGHMIDYILTRKEDIRDVCNVRVLRSADCDTDHKMVRGKFKLCIRKKTRMNGVEVPKRIDVTKLKNAVTRESLTEKMNAISFDGSWENFKDQVYKAGVEVLGLRKAAHRDWFDENDQEILELLQTKKRLSDTLLNDKLKNRSAVEKKYKEHKATLQRELRRMKNEWWSNISREVQSAYDRKDTKNLYTLMRQVFGPKSSPVVPLLSKDKSTLIKDPDKILERWREHFADLFFNPSVIDENVINSLPQMNTLHHMDLLPTVDEVVKAIKKIKAGKAPVCIPIELLQNGGDCVTNALYKLIEKCWLGSPVPQDWIDGLLVSLFKGKGIKSDCDHYRGITLLESAGKVLARILLDRLIENICPLIIPEAQCGFTEGRGTVDMVFTARQLQEKCIEQQLPLYQVFVDLTKAFDTVNRDALWIALRKIGCPPTFVRMFQELHRDMKARVTFNGKVSDELAVDNGVKQGDIPAPTLFSIYFAMLLVYAFQDCDKGIYIRFRTTGRVFNLRRFNTKTMNISSLIRELLYADDADFVSHSSEDMQEIMDLFSRACDAFGLTISIKKTKVLFTPAPGDPYVEPNILVKGTRLEVVDTFVYLGSTISRDGSLDAEMNLRISKASKTFGKLEGRVWSDRGITIKTKVSVYSTCVLTALLYSSECWTTHQRHIRQLERFHQNCLRRILNIKWQSFTPDTAVLRLAECSSIETLVLKNQLRWAGHVVRMKDVRIPKQLFYGELRNGKRPQHKPKKRFKDCIKNNLKAFKIPVEDWEDSAINRKEWRQMLYRGAVAFEEERIEHAELKRGLRKGEVSVLPEDAKSWKCEICSRILLSKAGYVNHRKSHESNPVNSNLLPIRPGDTTCVICSKICKSSAGLKRHMIIHKKDIPQLSSINPVKTLTFICHICHRPCKSAAGLQSHVRAHGRKMTAEFEHCKEH